ncbi:MAG: phosphonate C-P lyase system protein PhnG [Acetobacteraceae bacterium]|nr:phosphonate C-P lyase system protein PhnG [Acetobacteraceae bacterium]MCX7685271.1 phosphonate C-P lyase system protein PhnG [Acetobacteraceae bacterium]MDW8397024.1 phosphonate C-P lyase system protein PhnG [Acetobacteraceae bacterium]
MTDQTAENAARKAWLAVLARASAEEIEARLAEAPPLPPHSLLRGPEIGLVMVRGRAGGDGAPFNLGEMTVARCSVVLEGGAVGHALRAGRDRRAAELSAVLDAALQDPRLRPALEAAVIAPLAEAQAARRAAEAERAAATRVEFLSMVQIR